MKGRMFLGSITIDKAKVLDQQIIIKYNDYNDIVEVTNKYGGATILNGEIIANYREYGLLNIYSNNEVKLLIPANITWERLRRIKNCLDILGIDHQATISDGYWLNEQGHIIWDKLEIISFNTKYTQDRFNFILSIMDNLKWELNQEAMALFWNNQLVLI